MKRLLLSMILILGLVTACQSDEAYQLGLMTQTPSPDTLPLPIKGGSQTVYLVFDGVKYPIADWATFLAWGLRPDSIQTLDDAAIEAYPLGEMLYRAVSDGETLYFLIEGIAYRLQNTAERERALVTDDTITVLPVTVLDLLPLSEKPLPATFTAAMASPSSSPYPVPAMPNPLSDYSQWLQAFPRPENDNGRCIHYVQTPSGSEFDARLHLAQLQQLGMKWVLINYTSPGQLRYLAPLYKSAGIMVIWRPFVRPYQEYESWEEDVQYLRELGLPPYIQVFNEPSLAQEWDGREINQEEFLSHLVTAVPQVYAAGGFIGLQFINPDWARAAIQHLQAESLDYTFDRLFFVPHSYGGNHPPDYTEDYNSILGFRQFAQIFQEEIGYVPMMIVGEGGWRLGDSSDTRFPTVTEGVHRDYHLAVYNWFSSNTLSDGAALPDYLFGFCPWLFADRYDPAAWYGSNSGERRYTVAAVSQLPAFTRRFSWDE